MKALSRFTLLMSAGVISGCHVPQSGIYTLNSRPVHVQGRSWQNPMVLVIDGQTCVEVQRFEVTVQEYAWCVESGRCPTPDAGADPVCNFNRRDMQSHPMNCVGADAARTYCESIGLRLPTYTEWVAASCGNTTRFPWGEQSPEPNLLNAGGTDSRVSPGMFAGDADGHGETAPVGSFPDGISCHSIYDIVGNVEEWVEGDGSVDGRLRDQNLLAGGSWLSVAPRQVTGRALRADFSLASYPITAGFRCVADCP